MGKVKLTQEQADWIEKYTLTQEQVDHLIDIHSHRKRPDSPLVDLSTSKLARALYSGYEVEAEFKVGDWVITGRGLLGKYLEKTSEVYRFNLIGGHHATSDNIRHATPEEVAKEKERIWWKKHGREPWELKEDDVLEYLGDLLIVDSFDSEDICFRSNKNCTKNHYMENFDYVQKHFRVVCFAEDRKDV